MWSSSEWAVGGCLLRDRGRQESWAAPSASGFSVLKTGLLSTGDMQSPVADDSRKLMICSLNQSAVQMCLICCNFSLFALYPGLLIPTWKTHTWVLKENNKKLTLLHITFCWPVLILSLQNSDRNKESILHRHFQLSEISVYFSVANLAFRYLKLFWKHFCLVPLWLSYLALSLNPKYTLQSG